VGDLSRSQSNAALRFVRSYMIWLVIVVLAIVMSLISEDFASLANLRSVIISATHLALLAYGLTFVFLGGGFDLSSGATLVLAATLLIGINPGPLPLVLVTFAGILAVSAGIGAINGYLIGIQQLNPFIVTLGTRTIIGSIIFINAARAVYGLASQGDVLEFIGVGRVFGFLPVLTLVLSIVTVLCWFVVRYTPYARQITTVGASRTVARFSGLRVERLQMSTYVISSVLAGLAGILVACKVSYVNPSLAWHYDFDAITACAVGGISLSGGRGTIMNALSGVILLVLIDNSMVLLGVPTVWQPILKGAVLLVAIVADMQTKRNYA
jgi:ribose/xylose/arabinose/galactoside ABC-type transport system permease subunit